MVLLQTESSQFCPTSPNSGLPNKPLGVPYLHVTVVEGILQHVPLQQRLGSCALVCKEWASAAVRADPHIQQSVRPDQLPSLQSWLVQHAAQLHGLQLPCVQVRGTLLQLPADKLTQLQTLNLQQLQLQLPGYTAVHQVQDSTAVSSSGVQSSSGSHTPTATDSPSTATPTGVLLPRLRQLKLQCCTLDSPESLIQLCQSQALTSLELSKLSFGAVDRDSWGSVSPAAAQDIAAALLSLLQQLPDLQHLHLQALPVTAAVLQPIAAMPALQDLSLALPYDEEGSSTPTALPLTLTRLQANHCIFNLPLTTFPGFLASLPQLRYLRVLDLDSCTFDPAGLAQATMLEQLRLCGCRLMPCFEDQHHDSAGTAALLAALHKLPCLRHIELQLSALDTTSQPPERFAALTASRHLTCLVVQPPYQAPLPKAAAQYMFPANRRLPQLQVLTISPEGDEVDEEHAEQMWCLDAADLANIMQCCPNLQELCIVHSARPGADLSALLQLPLSCCCLKVGGQAFDDAAAAVVAQLQQLRDLSWGFCPSLTLAGLQEFTALTGLQHLLVCECESLCGEMLDGADGMCVQLARDEDQGAVWQQLQGMCSSAAPGMLWDLC